MASASESHAGAAPLPKPLPTPDAIRSWGVAEVAQWALTVRSITSDHANVLFKNEIRPRDERGARALGHAGRPRWAYHECIGRHQPRGGGDASEHEHG
jgi:hypothetical protein